MLLFSDFSYINHLRSRCNLLERISKLIMATDDEVRDEKIEYNINREAAKIPALSSGKIDKYEYLLVKTYYLLIKAEL